MWPVVQLKQLLKAFEANGSEMKADVKASFGNSIYEVETEMDALKRSWGVEMQSFSQLVAYLKGLKPSTTPGELFQLIHSFLKHLEGAMGDVMEAEHRAARAAASPARTGLSYGSPAQECSPVQVKDGVIQQMKALCRLTPEARRERLARAGSERRKSIRNESVCVRGSLRQPESSLPSTAAKVQQSKVCVLGCLLVKAAQTVDS